MSYILNCHKGEYLLIYLDIPIRLTKLSYDNWFPITNKIGDLQHGY